MRACFCCVRFIFTVLLLSHKIDWEEHFRNDTFCVRWDVKHFTQSTSLREGFVQSVIVVVDIRKSICRPTYKHFASFTPKGQWDNRQTHVQLANGHSTCVLENWPVGWLLGSVVERRSSAGVLSLSCARSVADGWPLMWVNRPLWVNQPGQLSLSSLRGR